MNSKFIIISLLFSSILISCHDSGDADSELTLKFQLTYNGVPLAAFDELAYSGHQKVFFTKYSFYLSNIKLKSNDKEIQLSEIEFIDFLTDIDSKPKAEMGISRIYPNVPAGLYDGLSFDIGVDPQVNISMPSQYSNAHPLANNGEYWIGWTSYIFNKLEGKLDHDSDGLFETNIAIHIGSDQAFRPVSIVKKYAIKEGKAELVIKIDLKQVLFINNQWFDFHQTHQIHSLEQLPNALILLDNCINKFELITN